MSQVNLISTRTITEEFMKQLSRLGLGFPPRIGLELLLPKSGSQPFLQLKMLFLVLLLLSLTILEDVEVLQA
jgi:hypothetical protein